MEDEKPAYFRAKADRYRFMMTQVTDPQVLEALDTLAAEFDALVARLESKRDSARSR